MSYGYRQLPPQIPLGMQQPGFAPQSAGMQTVEQKPGIPWGAIFGVLGLILLLAGIGVAAWFIYDALVNKKDSETSQTPPNTPLVDLKKSAAATAAAAAASGKEMVEAIIVQVDVEDCSSAPCGGYNLYLKSDAPTSINHLISAEFDSGKRLSARVPVDGAFSLEDLSKASVYLTSDKDDDYSLSAAKVQVRTNKGATPWAETAIETTWREKDEKIPLTIPTKTATSTTAAAAASGKDAVAPETVKTIKVAVQSEDCSSSPCGGYNLMLGSKSLNFGGSKFVISADFGSGETFEKTFTLDGAVTLDELKQAAAADDFYLYSDKDDDYSLEKATVTVTTDKKTYSAKETPIATDWREQNDQIPIKAV